MIIHYIYGFENLLKVLTLIVKNKPAKLDHLPTHDVVWHNGTKLTLSELSDAQDKLVLPTVMLVKWTEYGVYIYPESYGGVITDYGICELSYLDFMDLFE